jgi:hypothetical protein
VISGKQFRWEYIPLGRVSGCSKRSGVIDELEQGIVLLTYGLFGDEGSILVVGLDCSCSYA